MRNVFLPEPDKNKCGDGAAARLLLSATGGTFKLYK
jgi:hypothetical protein